MFIHIINRCINYMYILSGGNDMKDMSIFNKCKLFCFIT